jgi:RHS repeat-associated protein
MSHRRGARPRGAIRNGLVSLLLASVAFAVVAVVAATVPAAEERREYRPADDPGLAIEAEKARKKEAERQARRRTPEARAERRGSRRAYRGHGRAEALELARGRFSDELLHDVWRPLELRPGERLERYTGTHAALVRDSRGRKAVVQSALPLATGEGDDLRPVELALRDRGSFFEPENGVVRTRIAKSVDGGVELGGEGIAFRLADPAPGVDATAEVDGRAVFTNAAEDTDLWIKPMPSGAAAEFMLRSEESPESLALDFDLPKGAELVRDPSVGTVGIVRDGKAIGGIEAPYAQDAGGERIALSYGVKGDRLTIEVPHRSKDLEYPLYVDPSVIESSNWETNAAAVGLRGWEPNRTNAQFTLNMGAWFDGWDSNRQGLFALGAAGTYNHGDFAEWLLRPHRTGIHFPRVDFATSHRNVSTCAQLGIWGPTSFVYDPPIRQCHDYSIRWDTYCAHPSCGYDWGNPGAHATAALVAWGTGARNTDLRLMLKQVAVYLWDQNMPNLQPVANFGSRPWAEQDAVTVTGTAIDGDALDSGGNVIRGGIGLEKVWLSSPDRTGWAGPSTPAYSCDGTRTGPCKEKLPVSLPASTTESGMGGEGQIAIHATGRDFVAGGQSLPGRDNGKEVGRFRIDRSAPDKLNLGGIAAKPGAWFGDGLHALTLAPEDKYSGVRWHEVSTLSQHEDKVQYMSAFDRFERSTTGGLGTSERGGAWRVVDPLADYRTTGGEARIAKTGDANPMVELSGPNLLDVNAKVKMRLPVSSTASTTATLVLRKQPGGVAAPHIRIGLTRRPDGRILLSGDQIGTNWASKNIVSNLDTGFRQGTADGAFNLRVRLIGKDPIHVQARVWRAGTPELGSWTYDNQASKFVPIEATTTQKPGLIGFWQWDNTPDAATVAYDDVTASTWTRKTVFDRSTVDPGCTAAGQCPTGPPGSAASYTWSTNEYWEGAVDFRVRADDALGNPDQEPGGHSLSETFTVKVDRGDPALKLSGELHARRYSQPSQPKLPYGDYNLHIHGMDGRGSPLARDGSGMKNLKVYVDDTKNLDGTWVASTEAKMDESQPCPEGNCDMHRDWTFSTRDKPLPKEYRIRVVATDQADRKVEQSFVVKTDAPADPNFPEKLGLEDWFHYHSTDTGAGTRAHVNLASGNLVWHSTPVINPGRGLASVANVTYNSQTRPVDEPIPYDQVGRGFSLGLSGITRVNEPLDVTAAAAGFVSLTDPDGTRHRFTRRSASEPDVYDAPAGVHLRLRRFSSQLEPVLNPASLLQDKKAWAATRPDGVTYFFDGGGWPTTIEDRNGNVLRYEYEWLTLAGTACPIRSELDVFGRLVCKRRLVRLVDAAGVDIDPDPETSGEPGEHPDPAVRQTVRDARSVKLEYINTRSDPRLARWRLGESSGTEVRDSSGANHGTYSGGYALNQPGATLDGNNAVRFDGTGHASIPHSASLNVSDTFSVEAWFKRESTTGDQMIVGKGQNAYLLWITGGKLTLRKSHVGNIAQATVTPGADGVWHHVVATKKGPDARIYVDGVDVTAPGVNPLQLDNNTEPLRIGSNTASDTEKWVGSIDDVSLYNTVLTPFDVAQRYTQNVLWDSRVSKIIDHGRRETRFEYDDGYLTRMTQAMGSGENVLGSGFGDANTARTFQFAYESHQPQLADVLLPRKLTRVTDPKNGATDFRYPAVTTTDLNRLAGRPVCRVHDRGDPGDPGGPSEPPQISLGGCPDPLQDEPVGDLRYTSFGYSTEQECAGTCTTVEDPLSTATKPRTTEYRLDDRGRMREMQDALPSDRRGKTLLEWDGDNNVVTHVEAADSPDEARSVMTYTQNGQLETITDPLERVTRLNYERGPGVHRAARLGVGVPPPRIDDSGDFVEDLTSIQRPQGTWSFTVDGRGNVTHQRDPEGNFAETFFDSRGQITHEVDWREDGAADPQRNPIAITAYCDFDRNGMPQMMWTPRGLGDTLPSRTATTCTNYGENDFRWLFLYDEVGNLTHATDPREAKTGGATPRSKYTTALRYDKLDRLRVEQRSKDSSGTTPTTRTRSYGYDANDNLTAETDGEQRTWERSYTAMDLLREERSPSVAHEEETGTAQEVTRYEYDAVENRVKEIRPEGTRDGAAADSFSTENRYDEVGQLVASIRRSRAAAKPNVDLATSYRYDRRGNLIGIADPKINAANSGTAPEQNALDGRLRWEYKYDDADNRTAVVEDPGAAGTHLNLKTQFDYDLHDNLRFVTDPRGTVTPGPDDYRTEYVYDSADRLTAHVDARGGRTEWELRPDGRALSKTTPRGTATTTAGDFKATFEYYKGGDLLSYTLPSVGQDQYAFGRGTVRYAQRDAAGNPTQIQDARGNSFTNTFYDSGELKTTTRPSWWRADPDAEDMQVTEADPIEPTPKTPDDAAQIVEDAVRQATEGGEAADAPKLPSFSSDPTAIDSDLPGSEGHGDFGEVKPEEMPEILPAAGSISLDYDGEMRLSGVNETTCADCKTTIGRDEVGRVGEIKQPYDVAGTTDVYISRTFGYDRHGNLRRSTDGEGHPTTTTYDQFDRRTTQTDPDSNMSRWTYDANDNVTLVESPRGTADDASNEDFAVQMTYDGLDRLTARENGVERRYPTDNGVVTRGERTTFEDFDLLGNPQKIRAPRGNEPGLEQSERDQFVTRKKFDELNRIEKVTDVNGHATEYEYDANGNLTRLTAPGSRPNENHEELQPQVTTLTYDGRDLPWTKTTGSGVHRRVTATEYDANGNLRRVVNPRGMASTNLPSKVDDAPPSTSPGSSTDAGNTALRDAAFHATVYEYSVDNLMTSIHLPWGEGDAVEDRRRWRRDYERDDRGRVAAMNTAYEWTGDDAERCKEYKRSQANPYCTARTTYAYFDTGWIKEQTEPVATDPADNTQTPRQVGGTRIAYDYFGDGTQRRWRVFDSSNTRRRLVERTYTPAGRLSERKGFGAGDQANVTYTYDWDPNGNLEQMRHNLPDPQRDRVTNFEYDGADRPTLTNEEPFADGTRSRGKDTAVTYDENGNVKTRKTDGRLSPTTEDPDRYVDGKIAAFTYDALDREIKSQTTRGTSKRTVKTCWFASGQRESRTRINDEDPDTDCRSYGQGKLRARDTFFYADDGKLTSKTRTPGSGEPKPPQEYEYDGNGNRKKDERGTYVFNSRNHVVRWTRAADMRAEHKSVAYTVNGAGVVTKKDDDATQSDGGGITEFTILGERIERSEFTPAGGGPKTTANYTNSAFGNVERIEETTGTTTRTTTYKYDEFERLIEATGPAVDDPQDGDPAERKVRYEYDGLDRRDTKCTGFTGPPNSSTNCPGGTKRDYSYIGTSERLSQEAPFDGTGSTRSYDYDSGSERLGMEKGDGTYKSYATDAQGSVVGLEQANGTIADNERYEYDPYGELQKRKGQTAGDAERPLSDDAKENPFRFQGHYYDSGVKTYDMRARSYRPDIGRFLTADRFEAASGDFNLVADPLTQNRFAFAGGNPVSLVEFDGHDPHGRDTHHRGCFDCRQVSIHRERRAARAIGSSLRTQSRAFRRSYNAWTRAGGGYQPGSASGASDAATGHRGYSQPPQPSSAPPPTATSALAIQASQRPEPRHISFASRCDHGVPGIGCVQPHRRREYSEREQMVATMIVTAPIGGGAGLAVRAGVSGGRGLKGLLGSLFGGGAKEGVKRTSTRVRPNKAFPRGREYVERSHWLIPRRSKLPNRIKNGRWNIKEMWGTDHALADPFRYRFMPKWWKAQNPLPNPLTRFWNRTPTWAQAGSIGVGAGAGGGAAYAAAE